MGKARLDGAHQRGRDGRERGSHHGELECIRSVARGARATAILISAFHHVSDPLRQPISAELVGQAVWRTSAGAAAPPVLLVSVLILPPRSLPPATLSSLSLPTDVDVEMDNPPDLPELEIGSTVVCVAGDAEG